MPKTSRTTRHKNSLPKLIDKYYADLADLARQNVFVEMGTRTAFFALLHAAGREHGWTLIAEQEKKVAGKTIRPDGTFKDQMNLVRGYWEAKDTADKLDAEIEKKRKSGYPLNNIIFEDTSTAVLYQHGQRILTADMHDPLKLAELINEFFRYVEPEIEEFEQAVAEFKERVPDLAEGLKKKIETAHRTNPAFKKAFADFFELCQTSLNPNIAQAAVDEMLIQHILTERLIREIFDNPDFVRRNVIAAEVEKVMQAMTSQSFDRNTYLRELDRFYVAIEHAARTMTDWSDKQYFLNTVYERFFQGYSVKLADTMGIVYTPQEIVDFMCASVAEVLEKEFGKKLWSDDVYIIDPCTGTGNFIVNLIRRIPKAKLEDVYKHRLFANEIMLLPYYIAALNIEHAFFEQSGRYEAFEGLCFVDTLDLAEHAQGALSFMTAKNSERVERQKRAPITVVIGNPPYNTRQQDEGDRNRNREYKHIDSRIRATYVKASSATLRNQNYDAYIKFLRWATDRLGASDGIVCFITNNNFVDGIALDGLRDQLARDFQAVFHVSLGGNMRDKAAKDFGNVFGITVGVGITLAVRKQCLKRHLVSISCAPKAADGETKLSWLAEHSSIHDLDFEQVDQPGTAAWLASGSARADGAIVIGEKRASDTIFRSYSNGVKTNADHYVFSFSQEELIKRSRDAVEFFNQELDRYKRLGRESDVEQFVAHDRSRMKWIRRTRKCLIRGRYAEFNNHDICDALYRPFTKKSYFYNRFFNEDLYGFPRYFPCGRAPDNVVICLSGLGHDVFRCQVADRVPEHKYANPANGGTQCFPFYVYDEDGTNRRENITDWALKQFRDHYQDKKIDKWDIFHYVYGLLHHPGYRQKYADNLKRELPRIPFAPEFRPFAKAGEKLAKLHLDYEKLVHPTKAYLASWS